jgi:hypothetical protein
MSPPRLGWKLFFMVVGPVGGYLTVVRFNHFSRREPLRGPLDPEGPRRTVDR